MNPTLVFRLLVKDLRRLWPAVVVTLVLLSLLTRADRWRMDTMPSPMEGWLNLALPAAWACLAAFAVLQDPLVGDDAFWMTRPYGWPTVLGAKVLFVLVTIHVPQFLADMVVLATHDFSLLGNLPALLLKQALLFGVLTVPAMAAATLIRSFAHFVVVLFVVSAALAFLSGGGGLQAFPVFSREPHEVRDLLVNVLLCASAAVVAVMQFSRRGRELAARTTGIAAAMLAAVAFQYFPARLEYQPFSPDPGAPQVTLREAAADEKLPVYLSPTHHNVLLPVRFTPGRGQPESFRVVASEVELTTDRGERLVSVRPSFHTPLEKIDLMAFPYAAKTDAGPNWYVPSFSGRVWEKWKNQRVRVRGWAGLAYYRTPQSTELARVGGLAKEVPGAGKCRASVEDSGLNQAALLKVLCESVNSIPPAQVSLRHDESSGIWKGALGDAQTIATGPNRIWLSPIHRSQKYFHLSTTVTVDGSDGSASWVVPTGYAADARVEVAPAVWAGRSLASFDFGEVALSDLWTPNGRAIGLR